MTSTEIIYLVLALVGIGGFLLLVRRASEKQTSESARAVRDRLRAREGEDEDEVADGARTPRTSGRKRARADDERDEAEDEREEEVDEHEAEDDEREPEADERDEEAEADERDEEAEADERDEEAEADEETDRGPGEGERLRKGLAKTRGGFVARLGRLFSRKQITEDVLEEIEAVLFTADIGPKTAQRLFDQIKRSLSRDELADPEAIWSKIREESATILSVDRPPVDFSAAKPFVLLMIGVNGVGKTTTIGKIAAKLTREGKDVLLGAGDTFRAAAVEQLEIWGERSGAPVVKGKQGSDPASVIFSAIERGVRENRDVVICDTAGRLHTKVDLMDELKKVGRACDKASAGAPHETWLVLDATTGQNAIQQAQLFKEAMDITGIVLTKLDGTAKGGVILGICDELGVPVRYVGIGEGVDDLRPFDPEAFVNALYEQPEAAA